MNTKYLFKPPCFSFRSYDIGYFLVHLEMKRIIFQAIVAQKNLLQGFFLSENKQHSVLKKATRYFMTYKS